MHLNKSDLKEVCKELLGDFDGVLSWKWDKNFEALLAKFSAKDQEKVCSILERHFGLKWDSDTIRKTPDIIKTNTGHLGDLRRGQMLFTSDPEGNVFIFVAWWPWDDSAVVSVRIASPGTESSRRPQFCLLLSTLIQITPKNVNNAYYLSVGFSRQEVKATYPSLDKMRVI